MPRSDLRVEWAQGSRPYVVVMDREAAFLDAVRTSPSRSVWPSWRALVPLDLLVVQHGLHLQSRGGIRHGVPRLRGETRGAGEIRARRALRAGAEINGWRPRCLRCPASPTPPPWGGALRHVLA